MHKLILKNNSPSRFLVVFAVIFYCSTTAVAHSFPFRELVIGGPVPDVSLVSDYTPHQPDLSFSALKGKPFVAIFWGTSVDTNTMKEHSIATLKEIETLSTFFQNRGVYSFSVDIQGNTPDIIAEVRQQSGNSFPVFHDKAQRAYGALGVYVLPAILLVDKDGNVVSGMGYSREMVQRLRGAVEVMLGEKTVEQIEAELHPRMQEKTAEELAGNRRFNYALVLVKRGQTDTAIDELQQALAYNPKLYQARIELGCLYLAKDQLQEAEEELVEGLSGKPDTVKAKTCLAQVKFQKGLAKEAISDMETLLGDHPDSYELHYALAKFYESQQQMGEAENQYKQAYLLLEKWLSDNQQPRF